MFWFASLFFACDSCTRTTNPDILDVDNDGFEARDDCDDQNPNIYPGAPELCDAVDNNCNEEIDEGEPVGSVNPSCSIFARPASSQSDGDCRDDEGWDGAGGRGGPHSSGATPPS